MHTCCGHFLIKKDGQHCVEYIVDKNKYGNIWTIKLATNEIIELPLPICVWVSPFTETFFSQFNGSTKSECIDGALNVLGPAVIFSCKVVYSLHGITKDYIVTRKVMAALLQLQFCENTKCSVRSWFSTFSEILHHMYFVYSSKHEKWLANQKEKIPVQNSTHSHGICFKDVLIYNCFNLKIYNKDGHDGILNSVYKPLNDHNRDTVLMTNS